MNFEAQLSQLNDSQKNAVQASEKHILVSAGAGTGKTRVLTLRYNYLISNYFIDPEAIMAVTFTNKASYELKQRLKTFFPVNKLWIGTFHSLGMRILRQQAKFVSRTSDFSILDTGDQQSIVQKILKNIAPKKIYTPRMVMDAISKWKQELLLPEEVIRPTVPLYLTIYQEYQKQLEMLNSFDFDDLLLYSLKLFQNHPEILSKYIFRHILVDEYQDINNMQYLWIKKLIENGGNVFCVGDDDQSIYGWRGASIEKMLQFSKDFLSSEVIYLEDNYRSTPHILAAASHLIANNEERYRKVLRTSQEFGEKITVQGLWDSSEEAAFIAQKILKLYDEKESLSSIAVLVRTGAQTREFEERFMLQHIPYRLVGSARFYERLEIRDFMGYLRVINSTKDNLAFERIINVPRRGIGAVTLQQLYHIVQSKNVSLEHAAAEFCKDGESNALKRSLQSFLEAIGSWRGHAASMPPAELAEIVLAQSGYAAMWKTQGIQGESRIENLRELIKAMESFASLAEFLEHTSLMAEVNDPNQNEGVFLMTLHAAKGLEFDTVFLPGWEENLFPHIRCVEKQGVEEERRLAYVGITRAKKNSTITFCWNRRGHYGMMPSGPSRFINELPRDNIILSLKAACPVKEIPPEQQKRVAHAILGQGTVRAQEGNVVSVLFDRGGLKKVIARFLDFL